MAKFALLIDDDPDFSALLETVLRKIGIELVVTHRSEEFIAKIKEQVPSFCLVDLNLHGVQAGYALVKSLRAKFGVNLPVFIVSGSADESSQIRALEMGANDYILKPIDRGVLARKIARYVRTPLFDQFEQSYTPAPLQGLQAQVMVDLKVESIDECGVTFRSPHLLSKGTVFWVNGALLNEVIPGCEKLIMAVVSSNAAADDPAGQWYSIYAEFDDPTEEQLSSVRRYISIQLSKGNLKSKILS